MNIIITAGGTSEKIDNVRKITNSSSGKLGSILAHTFLNKNYDKIEKIYYISAKNSIKPANSEKLDNIIIENTQDVYDTLNNILTTKKIDVVFHSMAISDYTVDYVSTSQILSDILKNKSAEKIKELLNSNNLALDNKEKISSNKSDIIVRLVPTKKIISYIKQWSPNTKLVGFKLLSNVTDNELIEVASNLLEKNNCDYVVANDIKNIKQDKHPAFIIDKDKNIIKAGTKEEIAEILNQELFM